MVRKTRQSRRKTPWDNTNMTPTQQFIHDQHKIHYDQRHPSIEETGEAGLINSHVPSCCPSGLINSHVPSCCPLP